MDRETLARLTAEITSAYVGNNAVQLNRLTELINSIARALEAAVVPPEEKKPLSPAVSIKRAVSANTVTCLNCGRVMKSLRQHLRLAHGLTPDDYRARWGLEPDAPIVAPNYSAVRQRIAVNHLFGHKTTEPSPLDGA